MGGFGLCTKPPTLGEGGAESSKTANFFFVEVGGSTGSDNSAMASSMESSDQRLSSAFAGFLEDRWDGLGLFVGEKNRLLPVSTRIELDGRGSGGSAHNLRRFEGCSVERLRVGDPKIALRAGDGR